MKKYFFIFSLSSTIFFRSALKFHIHGSLTGPLQIPLHFSFSPLRSERWPNLAEILIGRFPLLKVGTRLVMGVFFKGASALSAYDYDWV